MSIEVSRILFLGLAVGYVIVMYWVWRILRSPYNPKDDEQLLHMQYVHVAPEITDDEIRALSDSELTVLEKFRKHIRNGQTVTSTIYFHTYPAEGCEIVRVSFSIRRVANRFFHMVTIQNQFGSYTTSEMEIMGNSWYVAFNFAFDRSGLLARRGKPLPYTGDMLYFIDKHIHSWPLLPIVYAVKKEGFYEAIA